MAQVAWPTPLQFPGNFGVTSTAPSLASMTAITTTGNYTGVVTRAIRDFTIADVTWTINALTSAAVVDVRVESISGGTFSGSLFATNTNKITALITATGTRTDVLTASAAILKGEYFGIKLGWVSGSLTVARVANATFNRVSQPFVVQNGSDASFASNRMSVALSDGAGDYYKLGSIPCNAITVASFNNSSTCSRGLRFQVPADCTLYGALTYPLAGGGNYNTVLADAAGATIATVTVSGLVTGATNEAPGEVYFTTPPLLSKDTTYYLAIEPTTTTNTQLTTFTLSSADYLDATPGGVQCFYATRTTSGGGAFTDDNTRIPQIELLIGATADGAATSSTGGGLAGGVAHTPMFG